MAIKAIFVGDEPTGPTRTPFRHAKCAARLQEWIDYLIEDADYILVNQSDLSLNELREYASDYLIVALGNNAERFCIQSDVPYFKLPHPSGRNRQLNDKSKLWLTLRACKRYIDS